MTIRLYTGTPGSGKSLHLADVMYWRLRSGRAVVGNVRLKLPDKLASHYVYLPNDELTPRRLAEISRDLKPRREGDIMLVVDECQLLFNARTWADKSRAAWTGYMQQHRKLGYDVYLVSQSAEMVDKQMRSLVEYEVVHRKLNQVGWVGKLASVLFLGRPVVCAVTMWAPMRQRLSAEWMLGRKRYYDMYDTWALFGSESD